MKRLARWFKKKGLPLLGHAAGVVVTGGTTAVPAILKKVTKSLGLPSTATQQEILAILSGSHEALALMRRIEKGTTPEELQADLDKYLAQLEYDVTALKESGQTNRVDAQSDDRYVRRARPTGLYLSFAWTTGWLLWIWRASWQSASLQERLILTCAEQGAGLQGCLEAVHATPLPISTLATSLKTIPIWALIAPFAPILSYYPLRSLDKLITKSVMGEFDETPSGPRYRPRTVIRQTEQTPIPQIDMHYREDYRDEMEVDFIEERERTQGSDKKANRFS